MSKAKKKSAVVLALSVLLLGAAAALVLLTLLRPGASSPELAVQHYEEACMLYDADGMVRYSSDYNRYVLYRSRTPESAGDYASGTNHTLPTGGCARAYSGVNIDSFLRRITYQELTRKGLRALAPTVVAMARAERLDAHAEAVRIRLEGGVR